MTRLQGTFCQKSFDAQLQSSLAAMPEKVSKSVCSQCPNMLCWRVAHASAVVQHCGQLWRDMSGQMLEYDRQAGEDILQKLRVPVRSCSRHDQYEHHVGEVEQPACYCTCMQEQVMIDIACM